MNNRELKCLLNEILSCCHCKDHLQSQYNFFVQHEFYLRIYYISRLSNASKFTNMINLEQHFAPQQLNIDKTYKAKFAF